MLFLLAVASVAAFWAVFPATENDEAYLQGLIDRKENGEILASGEEKDFCELMAVLRDSVSVECVGVLNGINWHRPPKSPEELGENWEEVTHKLQRENGNRRDFRHKKYKKIKISFDKGKEDAPFKGPKAYTRFDHWHRYNPGSTGKTDLYLNAEGGTEKEKSKHSHILARN